MPKSGGLKNRVKAGIALLVLLALPAQGSILFTPHLSEYAKQPRGVYADHTVVFTRIDEVFNAQGDKVPLAQPFIPPGESVDSAQILLRYLWVGNLFENTGVPVLKDHDQIFRVIGSLGWQQGSGAINDRSRLFGLTSGRSGLGDIFLLAGIYGDEFRWGPIKGNTLQSLTVKLPVGDYDTRALLNTGTNYWTTIPQLAVHTSLWSRLFIDATAAWQFNGGNDTPAYGGLTPTDPADVYNFEMNLAWKFSEKWYWDLGAFYRRSHGPNRYEKVTVTFRDPQPPSTACESLGIPNAQCGFASNFTLDPVPGVREDKGVRSAHLSTSLYYIYRASSVLNFRVVVPVSGRSGEFPMEYDVYLGRKQPGNNPISRLTTPQPLSGVQEAASIPATPFFELRFVYLFWAP